MSAILIISILLLSACVAPTSAPKTAKEWYEGGTLHKATVGEWHRATYANRLATCADWVVGANRAEAERDFSTVKPKAIELEKAITKATKGISGIQHHQVTEYAAMCIILMGSGHQPMVNGK